MSTGESLGSLPDMICIDRVVEFGIFRWCRLHAWLRKQMAFILAVISTVLFIYWNYRFGFKGIDSNGYDPLTVARRHSGQANILFLDRHVGSETLRQLLFHRLKTGRVLTSTIKSIGWMEKCRVLPVGNHRRLGMNWWSFDFGWLGCLIFCWIENHYGPSQIGDSRTERIRARVWFICDWFRHCSTPFPKENDLKMRVRQPDSRNRHGATQGCREFSQNRRGLFRSHWAGN